MISSSDSYSTYQLKNHYVILPQNNKKLNYYYTKRLGAKKAKEGFEYASNKNGKYLTINEIKKVMVSSLAAK